MTSKKKKERKEKEKEQEEGEYVIHYNCIVQHILEPFLAGLQFFFTLICVAQFSCT